MIRLDEDLYQDLRKLAFDADISVTRCANDLIRECIKLTAQTRGLIPNDPK